MNEQNSHLIINKFIRGDNIPQFIRINNDTIINVVHIMSIDREWVNSNEYSIYIEQYNNLMQLASNEYLKSHPETLMNPDEEEVEIADLMFQKFDSKIRKQLKNEYEEVPEPWVAKYKIKMADGTEYFITDNIYYQILAVIGIDMTDDKLQEK